MQVLSYLVNGHNTGITPADRAYENCTIGALSYYCAKTGYLELIVYRHSSTGHGLQSYRPSKKKNLMRAARTYLLLSFTKRTTSYVLAKSESFLFFHDVCRLLQKRTSFFNTLHLILQLVSLNVAFTQKNSNFYIKIQTYFRSVTCMIDVFC